MVVRSLQKQLQDYNLSPEILCEADSVYQGMGCPIKKVHNRVGLCWYCVYMAHVNLEIHVDPESLAIDMFRIEKTQYKKYFKEFRSSNASPKLSPVNLIETYGTKLQLSTGVILDIQEFCRELISNNDELADKPLRKLAISVIMYYLELNGIKVNVDHLSRMVNISKVTIDSYCREIDLDQYL
jgi:hypothetical protein